MNCQNCGHPLEEHDIVGCQVTTDQNDSDAEIESNECPCGLNEAQATRLAQRRKAAERINSFDSSITFHEFYQYIQALRDTGILAPGETEQDLLKELEGESA